ncbi:MAG: carboxypeptidase regulatory-like domain-containing protein, partial [Bryobacteraceae bacterium]
MKIEQLTIKRFGILALITAALSMPLFSQTTSGNLTGTVFDASGAAIPDATVTATHDATQVATSTTTTSSGQYRINNLLVGTYTLSVKASGFADARVKNVSVTLNELATANVTLQVGQAAQSVEVTAESAVIDTSTAQMQTTYDAKQLASLSMASTGSGVINTSLLQPGVATSGAIGLGTGPSVGGQRPRNNNFTVEGIDNNDKNVTGPLVQVPNDAVAEFTVIANQFSPQYGHSSGGQFNQVIKSGSNSFHGTLYEYFENRNLNAADNLNAVGGNPLHPRYDDNRFGGNFGGPIKKDKLFFFVDWEYEPVGQTASTYYETPTQVGYNILASTPGINTTNLQMYQKYLGVAPAANVGSAYVNPNVYLAGTGASSSQAALTTASGGLVPGTQVIPMGQVSSSLPSYQNTNTGVASLDYTISDKDQLRGRFILERQGSIDNSGFPSAFFTIIPDNNYLATASEYHNFSPNLTNELRLGYNRFFNNTPVPNQQFPGLDQFPSVYVYEGVGSFYGPDPNAPQYRIQNTYQINDGVNWTKGKHSFQLGFDGYSWLAPSFFVQRSRGDYEWSYLSDYMFDYYPDGIAQRSLGGREYSGNQYLYGFYGNDSWKLLPNFTVNIGLRWEYQTVPIGEQEQILNQVSSVPGLI